MQRVNRNVRLPNPLPTSPPVLKREAEWRPVFKDLQSTIWGVRAIAFFLLICCLYVVSTWVYTYHYYMSDAKCTNMDSYDHIGTEIVEKDWGDSSTKRKFEYTLVEYMLYETSWAKMQAKKKNESDVIWLPVLVIPGLRQPETRQENLARELLKRTEHANYRFRWFSLNFKEESGLEDGTTLGMHNDFAIDAACHLMEIFPKKRPIIIGLGDGGVVGLSVVRILTASGVKSAPNLLILESAPILAPPYLMDLEMQMFYKLIYLYWAEILKSDVGVVSFHGGISDRDIHSDLTRLKAITRIPSWTIPGVPDSGLWKDEMTSCKPFLHHISDLITTYAERWESSSGKSIVESFYINWDYEKRKRLPSDWKSDKIRNLTKIRTNQRFNLVFHRNKWIKVELRRDEFIHIVINGTCLSSSTIIRSQKEILRKEVIGDRIEFSIFEAKQFEDIRLLLESIGECHVEIETSSSWTVYGLRFLNGFKRDYHFFIVGALITTTYLIVIEGQIRSVRFEQQFELYFAATSAVLYHAFHPIGTQFSGFLCGVCFSLIVYFIFSSLNTLFIRFMRQSLESITRPILESCFDWAFFGVFLIILFCPPAGYQLLTFYLIATTSPFLMMPMMVPMQPGGLKASVGYAMVSCLIEEWLKAHVILVLLVITGIVWLETYFRGINWSLEISRFWIQAITYVVISIQMILVRNPLEVHYVATVFVLACNRYAVRFVPRELYADSIDLDKLENGYEREELYDRQAKEAIK